MKTRRAQRNATNGSDVVEPDLATEREDEPSLSSDDDQFSEQEEAPKRKSKRARTSHAKPKAPRKRYVRGKQGGLEGIMKMPMEIFTEIASFITPGDLVSLIWTNKFFRRILLQRSSLPIWQRAQCNVLDLPPCPAGMSEPQYAVLLFSRTCTLCGNSATAQPDPYLRVRLCPSCRDTKLEEVPLPRQNPRIDYQCVAKSGFSRPKVKSVGRHAISGYYCFREEVDKVVQQRAEFLRKRDRNGLADWERELKRAVAIQHKEGHRLREFIDLAVESRSSELNEVREKRRDIIYERLTELGWEEKYLEFDGKDAKPWKALVEVPKPLTDRIWTNILPKLTTLLEENRDRIDEAERRQRRSDRRKKLNNHLRKIKHTTHPYQAIVDALGIEVKTDTLSEDVEFPNPFPESAMALKWDFMLDMYEEEIGLEQVEELFNAKRAQVDQKVLEWRAGIESQLVERYGADLDSKNDSDVIVTVRGSTDTTRHLSRNARFLLRADTIFMLPRDRLWGDRGRDPAELLEYFPEIASADEIFFGLYSDHNFDVDGMFSGREDKQVICPERYIRNTKMETIAKALLRSIGMPDVAHVELDSMRRAFACGRCDDTTPRTWNKLLLHYLEALGKWAAGEKSRPASNTRHPIVFRNIHDLESSTDSKPFVRILSAEEAELAGSTGAGPSNHNQDTSTCMVCEIGLGTQTRTSPSQIRAHLANVHDVVNPVEGIHYKTRNENDFSLTDPEDEARWYNLWDAFQDAQVSQGSTAAESTAGPSGTVAAAS